MWQARRPSATSSDLGEKVGAPITAPNRESAERLAIARYGRPIVVERIVTQRSPLRLVAENEI